MDQLQQYWEIVKKQHFWILSGLAVLVPLVVCWFTSGKLSKAYSEQVTKISSTNSSLDPLTSGDHPNDVWVKHVNDETDALRKNVFTAWNKMYLDQQAILQWPAGLGPDFAKAFAGQAMPTDPDEISRFGARYQLFIKDELKDTAQIIGAEWRPSTENTGGDRTAGQLPVGAGPRPLVTWSSDDQMKLNKEFNWPTPPSPLAIKYAQEELWVRQAIFKAIARTNAGATGDFDAIVHSIAHSYIGYDATDKYPLSDGANRLVHINKSEGPGLRGAVGSGDVPGTSSIEPKRPVAGVVDTETRFQAATATGPVDPEAPLKTGRYVDDKGKPLAATDIDSTTEYRLLAFKLNIQADEQRWQKFLVELSNSPLPLEVREIRVDPRINLDSHDTGSSTMPGGRNFDETGTGMIRHDLPIEIYGFAYIMKPPDSAKLGITAESPDATTPAGATPAAPAVPGNAGAPTSGAAPAMPAGTTPGSPVPSPAPNTVPSPAAPPATAPAAVPPAAAPPAAPRGPADHS